MKGENSVRLNNASLEEAIQEYLNKRLVHPVFVLKLELLNNYGGMQGCEVYFEPRAAETEPDALEK